jgi:hypothetical protein
VKQDPPKAIFCALLVVFLAAWPVPASAQLPKEPRTFHVNVSYTGEEEDGSILRPFKSITAALSIVVPGLGDTIRVWPGRYDERFLVPPGASLIAEHGPDETFITGDAGVQEVLLALTDDTLLQGFTLGPTGGNSILVPDGAAATVRNCVVFGGFAGIGVASGGALHAINNTFHGNQVSINVEPGGAVADARNNIFAADSVGILLGEGATAATAYNNFFGIGPAIAGGSPSETDFGGNPGIADGANGIFHVSRVSITRGAGDPAPAFNDPDGSRNSLGAYGGPHAVPDRLAPLVSVSGQTVSEEGSFVATVDASASTDASGIWRYAFDSDLSDGQQFTPAEGPVAEFIYATPGLYLAAVEVTDNEGNASVQRFYVGDISARPFITASKRASAPPFRTQLGALVQGNVRSLSWDLDFDGNVDTRGTNVSYVLSENAAPGTHWVSLLVQPQEELPPRQALMPLTLTESPVVAVQEIFPQPGGTLTAALGGPLAGATITLVPNSLSESAVVTISQPDATKFLPPPGRLLAIAEFGPADVALARRARVSVPVRTAIPDAAEFHLYRWNTEAADWDEDSGNLLRVTEETVPRAEFELAQLGLYAISAIAEEEGGGNGGGGIQCRPTNSGPIRPASIAGDGLVGMLMLGVLAIAGMRARRRA